MRSSSQIGNNENEIQGPPCNLPSTMYVYRTTSLQLPLSTLPRENFRLHRSHSAHSPPPTGRLHLRRMDSEGITHRQVSVNGISMHVAEKGEGPVVLLLHGFPELWYSWRHQILALSSRGFRAVAPDLRGFGDTEAPPSTESYTYTHLVGDVVALVETLVDGEEKVFVAGHDWGAVVAWYLSLWRPDKVRALVNLSVAFHPRKPSQKPVEMFRRTYGDDHYIVRFQEPGAIEALFARLGTEHVMKKFLSYRQPGTLYISKYFEEPSGSELSLPSWLTPEDLSYFSSKFERSGFTGGINYYRCLDLSWELNAPWTGVKINVPTKFIVGDLDGTFNYPGNQDYVKMGGMKQYVPLLEESVVIKGAGHFIQQERAAEVTDHILDFFQKF